MSNLSTFYPAPITAADLGLGAGSNATFGSVTTGAGTFTTLTANNGTLTASAPVLDLSQTWNNAAVAFTGLNVNITNTASGALSNLIDIRVGGSSRFRVRETGFCIADTSGTNNAFAAGTSTLMTLFGMVTRASGQFAWTSGINYTDTTDLILARDGAAGTLGQRNGTNPQTFNIYNTFTSATNHERGFLRWNANVFQIGTEKGSGGGTARALEICTDGVARINVSATGGLGFFGATAVAQPAAIADATDAATTQARLNDLLAAVRTLGLIAT